MARTVLFRIILILISNTFALPAYSQAIAESVTLGAATSVAGTKAGSALGSALNRSSKQLAGHLQQQLSQSQPTSTPKGKKALLPKSQSHGISKLNQSQSGALVVSVRGAESNCASEKSSPQQGQAGTATPTIITSARIPHLNQNLRNTSRW
jgi:hypothetical protein